MWISKEKLKATEDEHWEKGLDIGYRLGFDAGLILAQSKLRNWLAGMPWGNSFRDKPRWEREIEDIMKRQGGKDERG